jgi:nucleotide-binding universal stress UspA family protein
VEIEMPPFDKILVPADFSEHSAEAVRTAADLSRRYDAPLTVVHVFDPVIYALPEAYVLFTPEQLDKIVDALEARLADVKQLAADGGAVHVETRLLHGAVAAQIIELAGSSGASLIVMGTRGRTGLSHLLLGSVAERVVRLAPCAVLTVKAPSAS